MADLESLRLKVRQLLHFSAPTDALAVYYAFYHDDKRTRLHVHEGRDGRPDGFVAICQTGQRLFAPTVVLRTPDARVAVTLLREALVPHRPYYIVTTPDLREPVTEVMEIERPEVNHIYQLDLFRMPFSINILVEAEMGPRDLPRFIIRSQGEVAAEAGISWASPHFAELFVRTAPDARRRGWGQAVLLACTTWVVRSGRQPLYVVNRGNKASIALAESVGFVDTGAREFAGEGVCRGS
ncbi:MAG TPA: GNAT family N-acetyltransferase [Anaerolineae bacterium]|nr:GNAT family N-acetyltransferase [Anaerolineae bacterium]